MRHLKKTLERGTKLLIILTVGACSSIPNPFSEKEIPLEGERAGFIQDSAIDASKITQEIGGVSLSSARLNANWSQPGGNVENSPGHLSYSGGVKAIWSRNVGTISTKRARANSSPIVHQGIVYVKDIRAQVTAISLANGGVVWQSKLNPEKERSPAAGGGISAEGDRIFVATGYGELIALSAQNGGVIWRVKMDAPARSAPTAKGGSIALVTSNNKMKLFSQNDGAELWEFHGLSETTSLSRAASPAFSGGAIIAPFSSGEVVALEEKSGKLRWSDALVRSGKRFALSDLNDIVGHPVVSNGVLYTGGISGRFVANDIRTGARRWTKDIMAIDTPVISGNSVFITSHKNIVVALDRDTGDIRWATPIPSEKLEKWTGASLANSKLWLGSNEGKIAIINAVNGQIEQISSAGNSIVSKPIFANGRMLVLTENGTLTAFQ